MAAAEGTVKGTGWPVDGHRLVFLPVGRDGKLWRLWRWGEAEDNAVMLTMFWFETLMGICEYAEAEGFAEEWNAGAWKPAAGFFVGREHLMGLRELRPGEAC